MQMVFWMLNRSILTLHYSTKAGLVIQRAFSLCCMLQRKNILLRKHLWPDRFELKRKFDFQISFTFKISEYIIFFFLTRKELIFPLTSKQILLALGKSKSALYLKISIHSSDFRPEWKSLTDLSAAEHNSVFEKMWTSFLGRVILSLPETGTH